MSEQPRLENLMARGWPDGLPTRERLDLERLSADDRETVRRRLAAVLRWTEPAEGEVGFGSAVEAAEAAGVTLSRFYQLVRGWKADRSFANLGVVGKTGRKRASPLADATKANVSRTIREILERDPDAGTNAILADVAARHRRAPSPTTLLRLIDAARRERPSGPFGAKIIFDSAGLDLVDPEGLRLRLDAAIDAGTGMVLGWAMATERGGLAGYIHAAGLALDTLHDLDLSGVSVELAEPELEIRVSRLDAPNAGVFEGAGLRLKRPVGVDRLGKVLVRAVGERIGPVWLGTGERADGVSFRTGRTHRMATVGSAVDSAMIDTVRETIDAINRERLRQAREVGGAGTGHVTPSRVRDALRRVADLWPLIEDNR